MFRQGSDGICHRAAPELPRLKRLHIKARDDAEIVRATLQGLVEIRRRRGIDVHHVAEGKHKLVVDNIVTNEAKPTGEEGHASTCDQSPDTDSRYPSSRNGQSFAIQLGIDVRPTVSRADAGRFPIGGHVDLLERCQVDGHSARLARSSRLGYVSAALDAELAFVAEFGVLTNGAEDEDSGGDILGRSGLDDAIRCDGLLLDCPEGGSSPDVARRERVDNFGTQDIGQRGALDGNLFRETWPRPDILRWTSRERRRTHAPPGRFFKLSSISEIGGTPAGDETDAAPRSCCTRKEETV